MRPPGLVSPPAPPALAEAAVPLTLRSAHVPGTRPWNLFAALWALGWGTTGALVAAGIHFVVPDTDLWPLMTTSLLFAEVVGFTAFLSARQVFPLFSRLAYPIRLGLQVVTLFSGTVFGSVAVLAAQPLFSLANIRLVSVIVAINAVLAVLVGITLHTYDTMKNQIEASYRALRVKEALERDLAIAREVQRELLPRAFPRFEGLELAGVCLPAVGVGGDYFDFLPLPGERLGVVVADVSGKGIPAALLMAGLQASVRSVSSSGCGPAEVNERVNALLHDTTSDSRYATMFFALYDPELRRIRYSNAGHFPPILLGPQGAVRLTQGGLPLGLFGGSAYGEGSREMQPGDVMVLCTDGLLEAPDRSGREFGETRLVEILERSRGRDLPAVLEEIVRTVRAWTEDGPPHDDITVVLVRSR